MRESSRNLLRSHRETACRLLVALSLVAISSSTSAQVINEFTANHTGTPDSFEYIELFGSPSTDYSHLTLVQIGGDVGNDDNDAGVVESIYVVGSTDPNGFWWTNFFVDEFEHASSFSIFLVTGWTGTVGTDLDSGNDGILDSTPWASIVDSIGVEDESGDANYVSDTVLVDMFDGATFSPGGASRIPNGTDTNGVSDWKRNDWEGAGLPGLTGNVAPNEVASTPGFDNEFVAPPEDPPLIHEVVVDHVGADDHEFVEIWGDSNADYSASSLLVIDKTGRVDKVLPLGTTGAEGFWSSGFLTDQFLNETLTLILVEAWSGSVGLDLDTNDDGAFDSTPWDTLYDSLSIRHGVAEVTYSSTILSFDFDGGSDPVGGAARVPNFSDTDGVLDWLRNDFDGAGFDGFAGTLIPGEAENTPGSVNVPHVSTFYAGVTASSSGSLRTSLHAAIDDHLRFPYSAGSTDTWDILELADEDPNNSSNILTIYRNSSLVKFGGGQGPYNREHSWPKSYGFPDNDGVGSPHTDTHHLMLSDGTYNGARGSRPFGSCDAGCDEYTTDANNGHGGVGGPYPGDSNWQGGPDGNGGTWDTWDHRRGDTARAQFYMDVRYEGGAHGISGNAEPNLILTNNTGLITGTGTNTSGNAYMGRLSTLLQWHLEDPPDDEERARNEVIYRFQGNRNPFVDHPEWAECLFEDLCGLFIDGFETGDTAGWSSTTP